MGFIDGRLMESYIPLADRHLLLFSRYGAAIAIAPAIGVTNDHNRNFIPADRLLARSRDYDLLFFRTDERMLPSFSQPRIGDTVIAYGQGSNESLREARGEVTGLEAYVAARCQDCPVQKVMVFDAEAGGGFSGGPVVDAKTGAVVGITFGYLDGRGASGGRRMYAYDMGLVMDEMRRLLDSPAMK
jgi:Trypsin-like peptidase domain